ncbi:uncharacterized protein LOC108709286 isoform X1 [Xenopus laevis]|uniref:Uncharacterized protein n=2 Tax=Xenopus laevis TaxID=8355 RepID=A0A974DH87_XENLA|nr:uncharacterized protein LOC108709286 isoform X1 [Xenopus laevis]OCT91390.1 hypothetical protein XELAEV_18014444mg [Xenopus laevis]
MRRSDRNNHLLPVKFHCQEAESNKIEGSCHRESARGRHKGSHRKGMCLVPLGTPHDLSSVLCMVFSPRITVPSRLEEESFLVIRGSRRLQWTFLKNLFCPDTPRSTEGPPEPQISDTGESRSNRQSINGLIPCWRGAVQEGDLSLGLSADGARARKPHTAPLTGTNVFSYDLQPERDILGWEVTATSGEKEQPHVVSIGELQNSLKLDLENHQTYLTDIESRLAGLERRAEDVTKHLERANLELKALKQGSNTLKNLVDQETGVSGGRDQRQWEDQPIMGNLKKPNCHHLTWNKNLIIPPKQKPGNQIAPESRSPSHKDVNDFSTMRAQGDQKEVQKCIFQCQAQIDALMHRVNKQIHHIEGKIFSRKKPCRGLNNRAI